MPIRKSDSLVLNKRSFRETSVIVNFYTRDIGKVSGILKGIRSEPSKFASLVEPFSLNEIIYYHKPGSSLNLVSQCDVRDNFDPIRQSIEKVGVASFMMELVDAVMQPEDKNEPVFDLALECLNGLKGSYSPDKILMIFKIKMLALSGFKPHLDSCISCGKSIQGQSRFSLGLGGLLCARCQAQDALSRQIFRGTIATMLYIHRSDFKAALNLGMNPKIKKELGVILNSFLDFHLEKRLKSQKVMDRMALTTV